MDKRRLELRPPLKWNQVAERAGLSIGHLSRIRKGEAPITKLAATQIETALEWEPGTVAQIMADETTDTAIPSVAPLKVVPSPGDFAAIENPSPTEAAMIAYMAAMRKEIEELNAKVDALARERDRDEPSQSSRDQKRA
jgi:transcriptional regulator with XRE-family HTH domain